MGILSPRIKVAVLRGGPSPEYEVSLKTGHHILSLLRQMEDRYEPLDIFISRDGEWHRGGLVEEPHEALRYADVVWNAMHGTYGEDGQVQRLLESLGIPYTGSGPAASAIAMNKDLAKKAYEIHGLLTPKHELLTPHTISEDRLIYIFRNYLHPVIVKPATSGSSIGIELAHDFMDLKVAVNRAFRHSPKVLVEEFIKGTLVSSTVIEKARGESLYALIPTGSRQPVENDQITKMSKRAHEVLGLRHYSSSDFIVTPRGKIYILETDALPVLHEESPTHESLGATGWKTADFVSHCLELALNKK